MNVSKYLLAIVLFAHLAVIDSQPGSGGDRRLVVRKRKRPTGSGPPITTPEEALSQLQDKVQNEGFRGGRSLLGSVPFQRYGQGAQFQLRRRNELDERPVELGITRFNGYSSNSGSGNPFKARGASLQRQADRQAALARRVENSVVRRQPQKVTYNQQAGFDHHNHHEDVVLPEVPGLEQHQAALRRHQEQIQAHLAGSALAPASVQRSDHIVQIHQEEPLTILEHSAAHHSPAPAPIQHAPAPVHHASPPAHRTPAPAPFHLSPAPAPAPAILHEEHLIAPAPQVAHAEHIVPGPQVSQHADHFIPSPAPTPAPAPHAAHFDHFAPPPAPAPAPHASHVNHHLDHFVPPPAPGPIGNTLDLEPIDFRQGAPEPPVIDLEAVAFAGERCIDKIVSVEETEADEKIECHHSYDQKCHTTYTTDFEPQQEEECEENFKKNCFIEYRTVATNETVEFCHTPLVKDCNVPGPVECTTEYESECMTRYHKHVVEEDTPECTTIKEYKCEQKTKGYSTEEDCKEWPVERCTIKTELVEKATPETSCKKVPKEKCAPAGCGFVPGVPECFDKVETVVTEVPEEKCDLEPQRHCKQVTTLVPNLKPSEECVDVPKEVCSRSKENPRKVRKPVVKKWCYTPTPESGLFRR